MLPGGGAAPAIAAELTPIESVVVSFRSSDRQGWVRLLHTLKMRALVLAAAALTVAGCGASTSSVSTNTSAPQTGTVPHGKPQAIQPVAGDAGVGASGGDPVGDPNAHA